MINHPLDKCFLHLELDTQRVGPPIRTYEAITATQGGHTEQLDYGRRSWARANTGTIFSVAINGDKKPICGPRVFQKRVINLTWRKLLMNKCSLWKWKREVCLWPKMEQLEVAQLDNTRTSTGSGRQRRVIAWFYPSLCATSLWHVPSASTCLFRYLVLRWKGDWSRRDVDVTPMCRGRNTYSRLWSKFDS